MPLQPPRSKLDSLLWRALTRYGRIKYRYLLPLYRLFGLGPNERASSSIRRSRTLRGAQIISRFLNRADRRFHRDQLEAIAQRVRNSKGAIIFLPSIGWEIVNTQRSHHLAREFARQGYVSLYDCSNAYDDVSGFMEIEPNLYLCRVEQSLLREVPDAVLWAFSYNFDQRDHYSEGTRVVYDWIDDLGVFPFEPSFLEKNHARALSQATLVLSVAKRLHEQALEARPDALYLPNGVDAEHFSSDSRPPPDDPEVAELRRANRPVAGYHGAMAEWFDYELLDEVARLNPDWNFLLIGPMYDLSLRKRGQPLLNHPNVFWIGARPYQSLPGYLSLFDVAIIPFVINNITQATSPLKLFEYFAGGKPVLTTPMAECAAFDEVNIARDAQEFSRKLVEARAQGQDDEFKLRLRQVARENSWTARVRTVIQHLNKK
jgi:glycosyltransferase involved in cell wall biosynthesis